MEMVAAATDVVAQCVEHVPGVEAGWRKGGEVGALGIFVVAVGGEMERVLDRHI